MSPPSNALQVLPGSLCQFHKSHVQRLDALELNVGKLVSETKRAADASEAAASAALRAVAEAHEGRKAAERAADQAMVMTTAVNRLVEQSTPQPIPPAPPDDDTLDMVTGIQDNPMELFAKAQTRKHQLKRRNIQIIIAAVVAVASAVAAIAQAVAPALK